jgi:hypothetical protein
MGNVIGTIYYDSSKKSSKYGTLIYNLRERHNLDEANIQNLKFKVGKACEGAEMSEVWVRYYGEEVAEMKMMSFLKNCKFVLEQAGATGVEIEYERKPLWN